MITFLLLALAAGLILMIVVARPSSSKRSSGNTVNIDKEFVNRKWHDIEIMIQGRGGSLRDAVSEADKLLDYSLKNSGVPGNTMGERLKNSGSKFSDINAVWSAHKLRNSLAHEADFDLVPGRAKEAVAAFRRGLKDLGAL